VSDHVNSTSISHICEVGAIVTTVTAANLQERVAEFFRRSVVDDRVDARIEVGETVPQYTHRLQQVTA